MLQLILQDLHVTYREIEISLGIIETIIHSIFPHNLTIAQKKACVNWSKEMLQKFDRGASKHVYDIVTGDESWIYAYESESKQQSTVWVFQDEPNPIKVPRA